jgi:hypothetical protein
MIPRTRRTRLLARRSTCAVRADRARSAGWIARCGPRARLLGARRAGSLRNACALIRGTRERPRGARGARAIVARRARGAHVGPGGAVLPARAGWDIRRARKGPARARDARAIGCARAVRKHALACRTCRLWSARRRGRSVVVPRAAWARDLRRFAAGAEGPSLAGIALGRISRRLGRDLERARRAVGLRETRGLVRRRRIGPRITRRAGAIRYGGARCAHVRTRLTRGPRRARGRVVAHAERPAHAARAASIRDGRAFAVNALARHASAP